MGHSTCSKSMEDNFYPRLTQLSRLDIPHRFILNKSENATLQLSIFCEKVLDKKYLLKLSNVS